MQTKVLTEIDLPGLTKIKTGKVREMFDLRDRILLVASDRISAFDCVLPTGIPGKGNVLNQLSAWWFGKTEHIVPNHMIAPIGPACPQDLRRYVDILGGRAMICRKAEVLPIECVARGYLIGSGWKEYKESGTVSGMRLRAGYRMADKLDQPIFTPARKAETGHDENISFDQVVEMVGADTAARLRDTTLALYGFAAEFARARGIIIADTKFEFGLAGGQLLLIDEALTPDSSRFWPASSYAPGSSPPSYDKQYVRDYLETLKDWDKTPPAPPLPDEVAFRTREKYIEAFRCLTGADPVV